MSTLTIIHSDANGRKTKWETKADKKAMEVILAFFGQGKEIKPRNPWGPKGMPTEEKRRRILDSLAELEAKPAEKPSRNKTAA